MKTLTITLEQWRREAPRQRAKSAKVVAGLGPIRFTVLIGRFENEHYPLEGE